ncbi:MAG: hypothetical protein MK481_10480, partial [SAR324 cluster bacterium]|nr:hypothetical protein [SAR324 cluster bacterium]
MPRVSLPLIYLKGQYCGKIKNAVELIMNSYAPAYINGLQVIPSDVPNFGDATLADPLTDISCSDMIFCTTVCYASMGMSKEKAEELCSFANYYMEEPSIISQLDYETCINDA